MTASIPAHPKILQMGKVEQLFSGTIEVQEKIDGSSFAFGRAADDGRLVFRSKGRELFVENVDKLFANTVAGVLARQDKIMNLEPGSFVFGEAMSGPQHNTLKYDRAPKGNLILFGATFRDQWLPRTALETLARDLDYEVVPELLTMDATCEVHERRHLVEKLTGLVDGDSILGGAREGIVIKNYGQMIHYNGVMSPVFCKLVSEGFKEKHNENWKPGRDMLQELLDGYRSTARWEKAVQWLREEGKYTGTVKDIGPMMKRIHDDVAEEEMDELGKKLAMHFMPQVKRIAGAGAPEWFKQALLEAELVPA